MSSSMETASDEQLEPEIVPSKQEAKTTTEPSKLRKSPKRKLNLNAVRDRICRYETEGYNFMVRKNMIYACKIDEESKKTDEILIAPIDDSIRDIFKQMVIELE